jgi:hypothetical protein
MGYLSLLVSTFLLCIVPFTCLCAFIFTKVKGTIVTFAGIAFAKLKLKLRNYRTILVCYNKIDRKTMEFN